MRWNAARGICANSIVLLCVSCVSLHTRDVALYYVVDSSRTASVQPESVLVWFCEGTNECNNIATDRDDDDRCARIGILQAEGLGKAMAGGAIAELKRRAAQMGGDRIVPLSDPDVAFGEQEFLARRVDVEKFERLQARVYRCGT